MTRKPSAGYPTPQYLQSGRVKKITSPPRGFKGRGKAEAERLTEVLAGQEEETRRARRREENGRIEAEIAVADRYLESLPSDRRLELERKALAGAPEVLNPRFFRKKIVCDHVRAILESGHIRNGLHARAVFD